MHALLGEQALEHRLAVQVIDLVLKAHTEQVLSLIHISHTLDNFTCDVLHCNDWHTAMAPVFLREFYQALPLYQNVKTGCSIHNIAFQGQYSAKVLNDILGLAHIPAAAFQLTCGPDAVNYMQGALNYTDAITTVSPTYAEEIKTPDFGEHLDVYKRQGWSRARCRRCGNRRR